MGEFLSTPIKEKTSEDGENYLVTWGCSFMQGWRKGMEDAHIMDMDIGPKHDTQLFGVFDGHGGREVAVFVGRHFTEEFVKNEAYLRGDIKTALEENYIKMDQLMLEEQGCLELIAEAKLSKEEEAKKQESNRKAQIESLRDAIDPKMQPGAKISLFTGCTAITMCLYKNKLYFANAGDSRAILCKKGIAYAMSEDHKPELPGEIKRIEKAGGWISDGRVLGNINLSRGLGDSEYKLDPRFSPKDQIVSAFPDVAIEELTDDCEFAVVACDGIWDCLTNQEVADYFTEKLKALKPGEKISSTIEKLLDNICATDVYNENGVGCDNMSCIVIVFKHDNKPFHRVNNIHNNND